MNGFRFSVKIDKQNDAGIKIGLKKGIEHLLIFARISSGWTSCKS
jgi:hypothetical protein